MKIQREFNFFMRNPRKTTLKIVLRRCFLLRGDLQNRFTFHKILNKNNCFINKNERKIDFIMNKL